MNACESTVFDDQKKLSLWKGKILRIFGAKKWKTKKKENKINQEIKEPDITKHSKG